MASSVIANVPLIYTIVVSEISRASMCRQKHRNGRSHMDRNAKGAILQVLSSCTFTRERHRDIVMTTQPLTELTPLHTTICRNVSSAMCDKNKECRSTALTELQDVLYTSVC